ncbi:type II toxin-antitoxin system RelE/ParE family toxin [Methylobacter sp.]|uniref:type II toxin-antitoxin system RelE/ParE family toxin n=1 Tax=Methylobacter sp. TaxID=2051955 RepID=UPI0012181D3D|nr:type II toxin-antitoxin system RelE/ParE family toxin [Methylobacter sp.]TAK64897.1 MAG: type II toxin-antitoxin system RelE/ParE family toxin [Methylobacter sp.]
MVIWSEIAKTDLRAIYDYIANDSKHYAKKVAQDIREKTGILSGLPNMGRVVPEMEDKNIRELSLYSYRIIYEVKNEQVYILTIVHKRQDLQSWNIKPD